MQPVEIQTTKKKFIISIDKNWIDNDTFMRFVEYIKSKGISKEETTEVVETEVIIEKKVNTARFLAAQKFKGIAASDYQYSKYDVYEQ